VIALLLYALSAPVDSTAKLTALYGGSALADLATTELAIHHGARESNPFVQDRTVRLALNAAIVYASVRGTQKLQRDGHPNGARVVKVAFIALRVVAVAVHVRKATR
jgi:hypothetical protein